MERMKKTRINDLDVEYEVIPRKVKYPRLEIKTGFLKVIVPEGYDGVDRLVEKHKKWIYDRLCRLESSRQKARNRSLNLERTDEEFRYLVNDLVHEFANYLKVDFEVVRFRKMKSRWGSCSSTGNININRYMIHLPDELIEYVVFHEVAHLVEMGHNKRFWNLVSQKFGDYREFEDELSIYWILIRERFIDVAKN
ncbi:hypothetical protein DSECCO2_83040 [anaerobic digester metagenome]